ncbi:MAG TPA: hypothetical protein VGO68_07570 [Pyrinomonadaceae bacterium]|nr:hypothetical protein [Pyrinomonadaceae bacterium]
MLASRTNGALSWRYNNPVTGDGLETDAQGRVGVVARLDPAGVDVGATDPADNHGEALPPQPLPQGGAYAAYLPHSLGGSGRCRLNGFEMGCGWMASPLATGLIQPVPELAYKFDRREAVRNRPSGLDIRGSNPFDDFLRLVLETSNSRRFPIL